MSAIELSSRSDRLIEAHQLNASGSVCEKLQNYSEAARLYEEALSIYEEMFGVNHYTTALVVRNLARVLRSQGNTAEASLLEDQAHEILSRRGAVDEQRKSPFGGSSGFFELLGTNYAYSAADDVLVQPVSADPNHDI